MHVVLPVYPGRVAGPWGRASAREAIGKSIVAAVESGVSGRVVVVSDDLAVLALAGRSGAAGVFREAGARGELSRLLPPGAEAALAALQERGVADRDPVLVTDFRNPLLASADLRQAAAEFSASGAATLLSIVSPRDNPCQLEGYYHLVETGVVHLFLPAAEAAEHLAGLERAGLRAAGPGPHRITRPFALDWMERGVAGDAGERLFVLAHPADRTLEFLPLPAAEAAGHPLAGQAVWVRESSRTARVVVPDCGPQSGPGRSGEWTWTGTGLREGAARLAPHLYRDGAGRHCLAFDRAVSGLRLGVLPLRGDGSAGRETTRLLDGDSAVVGCDGDVAALAYWLLEDIGSEAAYDVLLDAPGEGVLWEIDLATGKKVNRETGAFIVGRQSFPRVYEPEGSIGILPAAGLAEFDRGFLGGRCYGFRLDGDRAFKVVTEFDMVRYLSCTGSQVPADDAAGRCFPELRLSCVPGCGTGGRWHAQQCG